MVKCSKCGSTAQLKVIDTEYSDIKYGILKFTTYKCGCGHLFMTKTYYMPRTNEIIADDNV
jgi:hypothetical protein